MSALDLDNLIARADEQFRLNTIESVSEAMQLYVLASQTLTEAEASIDVSLLAGYRDTITDRLSKIRNCRDIDGLVLPTARVAPPTDPSLLVRAAPASINVTTDVELTKQVSLAMLSASALLALKHKGMCVVALPEDLYDQDYPGHYDRQITSISVSIPRVAGPYGDVACTVELAGTICTLHLQVTQPPGDSRPFSFESISDVILNIRYTARKG